MAFFLFYANGSLFSSRLNILALIVLVLVCFCSYCSSSSSSTSLDSFIISPDSSIDDADLYDVEDEITYYTPLKLSSHRYRNVPEQANIPSKHRFRNILFKTTLIYPEYRRKFHDSKRHVPQAFHAMRG